jgi:hypothetical protein
MARKHIVFISLAVALALVAGVFAATRTTELGASASTGTTLSDSELAGRDRELDRMAKQIRAHARKRPPKLPALVVPDSSGVSGGSLSSGPGTGLQLVSNSGPGSASSGHADEFGEDDDFDDDLDGDDESEDHSSGHGDDDGDDG